jgi:hypothetical protein
LFREDRKVKNMERQAIVKMNPKYEQKGTPLTAKPAVSVRSLIHPLLQLHHMMGNRAVGSFIQAKLEVSQPGDVYEQEADRVAEQVMQMASSNVSLQRKCDGCEEEEVMTKKGNSEVPVSAPLCGCTSDGKSSVRMNLDGIPEEGVADSFFLAIDGPPTPQMTIRPSIPAPTILRQPVPAPNSIRIVQNRQFPITASHVAAGWRSGFGGVSEVEVSNGTTDYDGTNISEHFIGGFGNNAQIGGCNNQSGQGSQGGSTFTVGDGVNFSQNGLNINLPPKHNTFYDLHIKGFGVNILPSGVNSQFSLCVQRYSFGGSTIFGRLGGLLPAIFFRLHTINRSTVGGQDVADIDLIKF